MGCTECKLCLQSEDKSQFEYPDTNKIKNPFNINNNELIYDNNLPSEKNDQAKFNQEFDEKLKLLGKYISEEEFETIISEITNNKNLNISNAPFPFQKNNNNNSYKMKPIEFLQGNVYHGEWNENMEMDGYGKYYLKKEKVLVEGIWEKGEIKHARIYYSTGEFYEGDISNSIYNGKGKLIHENKDEYIGEFLDGEKSGQGKLTFNDGVIYEGYFLKNKFNGEGVITWKEKGMEYRGKFLNNFIEGNGIMTLGEEKYEGNFEKNLFHGNGKYTYINGDEYDGEFEYGIRKGKGVYKQNINNNNRIIFEGMWDNNVPNGFGKIEYNGKIMKCNYHNGNVIEKLMDEDGIYYNNFDYDFYKQNMNLPGEKLPHIEHFDILSSQFKPDSFLSFLED